MELAESVWGADLVEALQSSGSPPGGLRRSGHGADRPGRLAGSGYSFHQDVAGGGPEARSRCTASGRTAVDGASLVVADDPARFEHDVAHVLGAVVRYTVMSAGQPEATKRSRTLGERRRRYESP